MFADFFILAFCLAAAVYWARWAILAILENGKSPDDAAMVAQGSNLEYPRIRKDLTSPPPPKECGRMAEALKYDFMAASYLARSSSDYTVRPYSFKERLLVWNFHLMRGVCGVGRFFSGHVARFAMLEMIAVVEYFAAVAGRNMFEEAAGFFGA